MFQVCFGYKKFVPEKYLASRYNSGALKVYLRYVPQIDLIFEEPTMYTSNVPADENVQFRCTLSTPKVYLTFIRVLVRSIFRISNY